MSEKKRFRCVTKACEKGRKQHPFIVVKLKRGEGPHFSFLNVSEFPFSFYGNLAYLKVHKNENFFGFDFEFYSFIVSYA